MKAVIVECSNGAAVALCEDGVFRKLANKDYFIGQELLIKQKSARNRIVQKLSICASLALVLLSFAGIGSYSYARPYSYVSLDINPSIEYALNRYDKVISVAGINNEGQQVVSSIEANVKNQNIATALGVTIRQLEKENYIVKESYNHVIVSVCSSNNTKAESIVSCVDSFSAKETNLCSIDTVTVSKEVKDSADSLGITPGKLALINAIAKTSSGSDFNVSEWTGKSVVELENTIQQAHSQSQDSEQNPAQKPVFNSEYLSSALDDSIVSCTDGTATASAIDMSSESGSASTDKKTSAVEDSDSKESVSASKQDNVSTASAVDQEPESSGSTGQASVSGENSVSAGNSGEAAHNTDKNVVSDCDTLDNNSSVTNDSSSNSSPATSGDTATDTSATDEGSANEHSANGDPDISASEDDPNKNISSGKDEGNGLSDGSGNSANSGQKNDNADGSSDAVSSNSGTEKDAADDSLTEESSSKKDSCTLPDTDALANSSNTAEGGDNITSDSETEGTAENISSDPAYETIDSNETGAGNDSASHDSIQDTAIPDAETNEDAASASEMSKSDAETADHSLIFDSTSETADSND